MSRRNRPRSSGEHGKDARQRIRSDHDRFVSVDGRHGREGDHAMRARGPWHQLNGKCRDTSGGYVLDRFQHTEWTQEAYQRLVRMKVWKISFTRSVVRTVTEHLNNRIRYTKNIGTFRENFHSLCRVLIVRIAGFHTCSSLHDNFQSRLG